MYSAPAGAHPGSINFNIGVYVLRRKFASSALIFRYSRYNT